MTILTNTAAQTKGDSRSRFRDRKPIVCACGDHAFVAITKGYTTMVSPEDAFLLAEKKWCAEHQHGRIRVRRMDSPTRKHINLGAAVLRLDVSGGLMPDHINLDPTDNRRTNLRPATNAQNQRNRGAYKKRRLPKGVTPDKGGRRFVALIWAYGTSKHLGTFDTPDEAHAAYVVAARELFGEFARAA